MAILEIKDLRSRYGEQTITTEGIIVHHSRDPKTTIPILYFQNEADFERFSTIANPFYGISDICYKLIPSNHGNSYTHYGDPAKLIKLRDSDEPIVLPQTRQDRLLYELLTISVYEELYKLIAHSK